MFYTSNIKEQLVKLQFSLEKTAQSLAALRKAIFDSQYLKDLDEQWEKNQEDEEE